MISKICALSFLLCAVFGCTQDICADTVAGTWRTTYTSEDCPGLDRTESSSAPTVDSCRVTLERESDDRCHVYFEQACDGVTEIGTATVSRDGRSFYGDLVAVYRDGHMCHTSYSSVLWHK